MMYTHHPYPEESDMSVRVMVGDPIALAWLWLVAYTEYLNEMIDSDDGEPLDVDELIDAAMSHVNSENRWGGNSISRGGAFESFQVDPTIWDKLAILKEIEIPQHNRNSFFSCSC